MAELERRSIAINFAGAPLLGDLSSSALVASPMTSVVAAPPSFSFDSEPSSSSTAAAPSGLGLGLDLSATADTSLLASQECLKSPRPSETFCHSPGSQDIAKRVATDIVEVPQSVDQLPLNILLSVIDYLEDPADILRLGMTCHHFLFITDQLQEVWKVFVYSEFGQTMVDALEASGKTSKPGFCWRRRYSAYKILLQVSEVPLHWCADHAANEKIKVLIRAGTPADWMDLRQHRTALHIAASRGHLKTCALLIAAGADVNGRSIDDRTAVHYACKFGRTDVIKLLLKKGAQLDVKDKWEKTGLEYAVTLNRVEVVELFLSIGLNINYRFGRNRTMLHVAAAQNHLNMIDVLMSKDANLNVQDEDQRTPLHFASQRGFTEVVQKLLDADADPTIKDSKGYLALDFARGKANLSTTRALISWYKTRNMEVPKPPANVKSLIPKAKNTNRLLALQLDGETDRNAIAREIQHTRQQFNALRKKR